LHVEVPQHVVDGKGITGQLIQSVQRVFPFV